jgi:Mce-associated membrane protein
VAYAGVVDVDADTATVIAATAGTVASEETDNRPVRHDLRLRLELVHEDGRWLISDLTAVS